MPGQMNSAAESQSKSLLEYLLTRYYSELSRAAHLSGPGLLMQGAVVLPEADEGMQRKYFSDQVMTAMIMLFSLCGVLILRVMPEGPLARRLESVWNAPNMIDSAIELFRLHFEKLLSRI